MIRLRAVNRVTTEIAQKEVNFFATRLARLSAMLFFVNFLDRLHWPSQRVSAPQWPLVDTLPLDSPSHPCASGRAAVGRWCKVLSRAFKAAAVADEGADPIRSYPLVCSPLVLLRPSSQCKAGRQVGVIINGRGKI